MFPVAGYTAQAVSENLSVTQPVAGGWVSIWPEGAAQPSPLVASITYTQGQTISNAVSTPEKPPPDIRDVVRVPVDEEGREIDNHPA